MNGPLVERMRAYLRGQTGKHNQAKPLITEALYTIVNYERKLNAVGLVYDAVKMTAEAYPTAVPKNLVRDLKAALEA